MPRTDEQFVTLDNKPAMIGGRFRIRLVKQDRGKAVIGVLDLTKQPPLITPDVDELADSDSI